MTIGKATDTIKAKLIVTLRYGLRPWPNGPATWILGAVMLTTASPATAVPIEEDQGSTTR